MNATVTKRVRIVLSELHDIQGKLTQMRLDLVSVDRFTSQKLRALSADLQAHWEDLSRYVIERGSEEER